MESRVVYDSSNSHNSLLCDAGSANVSNETEESVSITKDSKSYYIKINPDIAYKGFEVIGKVIAKDF